MNREAAALGVPVYSIFRGKIGAVDRQLHSEGKLLLIEQLAEVQTKIRLQSRTKEAHLHVKPRQALQDIVGHVQEIVKLDCS